MKSILPSLPAASRTRSIAGLIALSVLAGVLSSCRTTEGFGQDLQKVGNKIEREAERRG